MRIALVLVACLAAAAIACSGDDDAPARYPTQTDAARDASHCECAGGVGAELGATGVLELYDSAAKAAGTIGDREIVGPIAATVRSVQPASKEQIAGRDTPVSGATW